MNSDTPKAVIYCRVSSIAQLQKGDGLSSQETRCREFARAKSYEVREVFRDEGASGGVIDRPGMQAMLKFLRRQKADQYIVLIDDISRLARGLEAHIQLRTAIDTAGGKLESPSIEFGEDSDSILVENLLASVSQHQRQKNAEQTRNRMIARTRNGYWVFNPPVGYRFARVGGHTGQVLIRDEPVASVVQEALEGFAHGRFETQAEVKRFLDASPHYPKDGSGEVRFQRVTNLLGKEVYAGYISAPKWGLSLIPAKHEALISFETYQAIQNRLKAAAKAPVRKDIHEDFPLRGFVTCGGCGHPMTACWSKGRSATYPYYMCFKKGCDHYRKSIRKEKLEEEFETLLLDLQLPENLLAMARAMFRELWERRSRNREQDALCTGKELRKLEKQAGQLLDRIVKADNQSVIGAYEKRLKELEEQKIILSEKIAQCGSALPDFDDTFRTAFEFLLSPCNLWRSKHLEDKRTALKLLFTDKLPYDRNKGFRTANFTLPFKVLGDLRTGKCNMAERAGFEPAWDGKAPNRFRVGAGMTASVPLHKDADLLHLHGYRQFSRDCCAVHACL